MGVRIRSVIAVAWQVQQRYKLDASDQLAAAIAFFAFISFVPLLLLAVSVVGFVLTDPDAQLRVALSLTRALPGFDETLDEPDSQIRVLLEGVVAARGTVGLIGLGTLLLTGLKVMASLLAATRVVFRGELLTGVLARLRQLLAMVVLGVVAAAAVFAASLLPTGLLGGLHPTLGLLVSFSVSFVLDVGLFTIAYTVLSPSSALSVRQLLPGALLAGFGWSVLKLVSGIFVANQIEGANALYGALGSVFALLLLLYLAGRLYLYGAELSAVLFERREGTTLEQLHGPVELRPPPTEKLAALADRVRDHRDDADPAEPDDRGRSGAAPGAPPAAASAAPSAAGPAAVAATTPTPRPLAVLLTAGALLAVWRLRRSLSA